MSHEPRETDHLTTRARGGRALALLLLLSTATGVGCGGLEEQNEPAPSAPADEVASTERALMLVDAMAERPTPFRADGVATVSPLEPAAVLDAGGGATMRVAVQQAATRPSARRGALSIYEPAARGVSIAMRTAIGSLQIFAVLKDAMAPTGQRYALELPAGSRLQATADGGFILVAADGTVVGRIDAPWAKDAAHRELRTRYALEGNVLVQETDTAGAQFPVVVDPRISFGRYIYIRFNPTERREIFLTVAQGGGLIAGALVCSEAPVVGQAVCGAVGVVVATVVFEYVYDTYYRPECGLEVRLNYWGGVAGSRLIRGDSATSC